MMRVKKIYFYQPLQLFIDNAQQDILAQVTIALSDSHLAKLSTQRLFAFHRMEMEMRRARDDKKVKTPLDYSLSDFYLLKSCDVFLSRIIVKTLADDENLYDERVDLFDQLGEVLDDMMDVKEDIEGINSNRFLISLVERWVQETLEEYTLFIDAWLERLAWETEWLLWLWLNYAELKAWLNGLTKKDRSHIQSSKTNDMLFGVKTA